MKLYPTSMNNHGPARSLEDYLEWLCEELDAEPGHSARAHDLCQRILALQDEIDARSGT